MVYWLILPIIFIIYNFYVEVSDQDCDAVLRGEPDRCLALRGRVPLETDSDRIRKKQTLKTLERASSIVIWRIAAIVALIVSLFIFIYINYTTDTVKLSWAHYLIMSILIFVAIYAVLMWSHYHTLRPMIVVASDNIRRGF